MVFDQDEARLPPKELYRLLKRKVAWAEKEHQELANAKNTAGRKSATGLDKEGVGAGTDIGA